jgi:hypothetical protein
MTPHSEVQQHDTLDYRHCHEILDKGKFFIEKEKGVQGGKGYFEHAKDTGNPDLKPVHSQGIHGKWKNR